jgi:hypothetical protein
MEKLSRRAWLQLIAASGAAAAGGDLAYAYAPWWDYDENANQVRRPLTKATTVSAQMRELVRYATLAGSGHNAQPWKFAMRENAIEIRPDFARRLPTVDPNDRELWISLGCALENLIIAARAAGYESEVTYPDAANFIHVRLKPSTPESGALFRAIPLRQNTRSEFDGRRVPAGDLDQLLTLPLEPGVTLRAVTRATDLETVLEYVNRGNLTQYADKAFVDELIHWVRFNKQEALSSRDGLYSASAGRPQVPRWLGQMIVARTTPQQQADADARNLRSSAGAIVVASQFDSKISWVRTGQVYGRVALKLTSLNLTSAFLNQPIEVAAVRGQFQSGLALGDALPQLLFRFGYAHPLPRSLRRPLDQVIVQS